MSDLLSHAVPGDHDASDEVGEPVPEDGFEQCIPADFTDAAAQLAGVESLVRSQLVSVIRAVDRRDGWEGDATDLPHWVSLHADVCRATAKQLVAVARALDDLPHIGEAFTAGRLGWDRVRFLVEFADADSDQRLADECDGLSIGQVEALARQCRRVRREQSEENDRQRGLRITWNRDKSSGRLVCHLDAPELAIVEAAIDAEAERHRYDAQTDAANAAAGGVDDHGQPLPRAFVPHEQAAADALVAICSKVLGAEADPDRACVVVHTSIEVLFGLDGPGELANGVSISPDTVRRLCCDGRLEVITEKPDGTPIGIGRASRRVPAWLARQVRRRDQGCRFPECPCQQIQIHHLDWWVRDKGLTDLDDLLGACRKHHRLLHEGKWIVERHADGSVTWISPSGGRYTSALPGLRPEVADRIAIMLPFPVPKPDHADPGAGTGRRVGIGEEQLDPSGTDPP
jgi:hypothetical protein